MADAKRKKSDLDLDEDLEKAVDEKAPDYKPEPIVFEMAKRSGVMNYIRNKRNKKQSELDKAMDY